MKTIIVAGMNKAVHRAVFQLCERLFAYRWDIMILIGVILFNQNQINDLIINLRSLLLDA